MSAEDLIFLIRHDRAKVNRLRTYLSWKEVRKHAKDSGGDGGAPEVDLPEDAADGTLVVYSLRSQDVFTQLGHARQTHTEGAED